VTDRDLTVPAFPGGPDPSKPVPREAVEGFDLSRYAKLSARLAEGKERRDLVLSAEGLTERSWAHVELTWMLRIATEMLHGDTQLALEFDRLYVEAQDSLGPTDPVLPLDRYAHLVAQLEGGRDPVEAFHEHGLSLADAARLQRAWTKRLAQDPAMMETFREMVEGARAG
jgi:hypothetical protein